MSEEPGRYKTPGIAGCIFCSDEIASRIIATNQSVFAIEDKFPVSPGNILVIPYRHTKDYFSMTQEERRHAEELLWMMKDKVRARNMAGLSSMGCKGIIL